MQAIDAKNNLWETAFFLPTDDVYDLRWFMPSLPVELCGNATLGSAFLILTRISCDTERVRFTTLNVPLDVVRDWECFFLDFPAHPRVEVASPPQLSDGLGEPDLEIETRCPSDISARQQAGL